MPIVERPLLRWIQPGVHLADGRRIEARDLIDDLNIAMKWLSYPGRVNSVTTAAALDFTTPGGSRET